MATTDTYRARLDDWVRLTRTNGGNDDVERTYVAKVVRVRGSSEEAVLNLYSRTGAIWHRSYWVPNNSTYLAPFDGEPTFQPLLAHIPNTPEVQEFKDIAWTLFNRYANSHGYTEVVRQALAELGIEKPDAGTIDATVTFTITGLDIDSLLGEEANATNFEELWGRKTTAQKLELLSRKARSDDTTITHKVNPKTAPAAPAPSAK